MTSAIVAVLSSWRDFEAITKTLLALGDGMTTLACLALFLGLLDYVHRNAAGIKDLSGTEVTLSVYYWIAVAALITGIGAAINILTIWGGVIMLDAMAHLIRGAVWMIVAERTWRSGKISEQLWKDDPVEQVERIAASVALKLPAIVAAQARLNRALQPLRDAQRAGLGNGA